MSEIKFKKGDRVRALIDSGGYFNKGDTGVVEEASDVPLVKWDENGKSWYACQDELELIEESYVNVNIPEPEYKDPVNHPDHYTSHPSGVECIEITEHMGFCLGNAVKYIWRSDLKGDSIQDLEKAKWYIERELKKRNG